VKRIRSSAITWNTAVTASASLLLLVLAEVPALAQSRGTRYSDWWPKVELIDGSLHNGRWKYARKSAAKLGDTITRESWGDPDLGAVLAELALYQAIAEANLDLRDDAIWHWHTALNLEPTLARRDLSSYGKAERLLVEFPLRKRGEMPPGFPDTSTEPGAVATTPVAPPGPIPTVVNNNAGARESTGNFEAEIIVDSHGELHQPLVISRQLHPVVIYSCLEWLHEMPPFEPGRIGGQAVSALYPLIVQFQVSPYGGHLTIRPPQGG